MSEVDYYAILGVGPDAENDELEDADQRTLARAEPGRARRLADARAVLLDPVARADYDARCVGAELIEETAAAILEAIDARRKRTASSRDES